MLVHFVLPHVLRYITPNRISEDHLILTWKSSAHRHK